MLFLDLFLIPFSRISSSSSSLSSRLMLVVAPDIVLGVWNERFIEREWTDGAVGGRDICGLFLYFEGKKRSLMSIQNQILVSLTELTFSLEVIRIFCNGFVVGKAIGRWVPL